MTTSRASRIIAAWPEALWAAFTDPAQLVDWLPPGSMTGKMHAFDLREGGGYEMSLYYPDDEPANRGKTAAREDRVRVRFVELAPPARLVEAVTFQAKDSQLQGEMRLTVTLTPAAGGTEVAMLFEGLPPGVRPEDNDEGARLSLEQLARRMEA